MARNFPKFRAGDKVRVTDEGRRRYGHVGRVLGVNISTGRNPSTVRVEFLGVVGPAHIALRHVVLTNEDMTTP